MAAHRGGTGAEKAVRYLGLLDQALCNGNWSEIPELARKVDKHAPDRKALTLAARSEAQIASASHRPSSASSAATSGLHSLSELVPRLQEAAAAAHTTHPDDSFIATVCAAKIYWLLEDAPSALRVLGDATAAPPSGTSGSSVAALGWSETCRVKRDLIEADSLDTAARQAEALGIYQATTSATPGYRSPELRRWTERLLARACMYNVKKIPAPLSKHVGETYAAFKTWGDFWQRAPPSPSSSGSALSRLDIPRRLIWKEYYDLLSSMLQEGLVYNTASTSAQDLLIPADRELPAEQLNSARRAQHAEFKRVESTYESLLLSETKFPKSSQTNIEVEEWVEQAISNWQILTGPDWSDAQLCEGGKELVSRTVLDILYRAATKTFHSTAILRRLFQVHAALGEFDLSMHALTSYVEIIDRGKARAEKTGEHELGFDNDDVAVLTAAEAVRVLCRYGDNEHIQKAGTISATIETWLNRGIPDVTREDLEVERSPEDLAPQTGAHLKSETLAAAYRAIGVYHAESARFGFEKGARKALLAEANNNLRRAQKFDSESVETAHALALVLAEMRDVPGAIEVIRDAIATASSIGRTNGVAQPAKSGSEYLLVPLWHLLALCLTAKDQFEGAARLCETALDSFGGSETLFGRYDAVDSHEKHSTSKLERLDSFEKEMVIQVKMSQIVLVELMEGPDDAVDLTDELLSLYSKLFGSPKHASASPSKPPPITSPTTSPKKGGTLRSIAGSIRPKSVKSFKSGAEKDHLAQNASMSTNTLPPMPELRSTNGQAFGAPIEITITNEDGVPSEKSHERHSHLPHLPFRGHKDGSGAKGQAQSANITNLTEKTSVSNELDTKPVMAAVNQGAIADPGQTLAEIPHNGPHDQLPPPSGHDDQPPRQDTRLPVPHPAAAHQRHAESHLSVLQSRRHRVSLLIRIWLFIAGVYIKAESYEDAQNAIDDATKWAESLELELSQTAEGSNAKKLFFKGWGGGKGIDELWADLWSVTAQLSLARQRPFDAIASYEQALSYFPDHPEAIVGISNLLMDQYEEKIPAEEPVAPLQPYPTAAIGGALINEARPALTRPNSSATAPSTSRSNTNAGALLTQAVEEVTERRTDPSPAQLNRLAARDRAYMLLTNLTKLGVGWDNSEAWLTLARAHELSREIGKAKNALWWVVELEENRPVRDWRDVNPGGYTL